MVVFVCGACGTSLKKSQVHSHSYKCQGCQYMTCMDCSKDFWGDDYANHNICVTEDQKYGGTNYVPKEMKGQKKQEAWIEQIRDHIASRNDVGPKVRQLFDRVLVFDNIPRKRVKFINFLRSQKYNNDLLIENAWRFFADALKKDEKDVTDAKSSNDQTGGQKTKFEKFTEKKKVIEETLLSAELDFTLESSYLNRSMKKGIKHADRGNERRKEKRQERRELKLDAERRANRTKKSRSACRLEKLKRTKEHKKSKRKRALDDDADAVTQETEIPKKKRKGREETNQENEEPLGEEKNMNSSKKKRRRKGREETNQENEEPLGEEKNMNSSKKKKRRKGREETNQENEEPLGEEKNINQEESNETSDCSSSKQSAFKWKTAINTILKDAPEEGMKMKKLRRKLFAVYMESKADAAHIKSEHEIDALISKKVLRRNDQYLVIKDRIKLKNAS